MSTSATATAGPQPSEGAGPSSRDRLLLRTFEPGLRFTDGELFLPTSVDGYVARCSLWAGGHRQGAAPLAPAGAMTDGSSRTAATRSCSTGTSTRSTTGVRPSTGST